MATEVAPTEAGEGTAVPSGWARGPGGQPGRRMGAELGAGLRL